MPCEKYPGERESLVEGCRALRDFLFLIGEIQSPLGRDVREALAQTDYEAMRFALDEWHALADELRRRVQPVRDRRALGLMMLPTERPRPAIAPLDLDDDEDDHPPPRGGSDVSTETH